MPDSNQPEVHLGWVGQMLLEVRDDLTAHTAREEERDSRYKEVIDGMSLQLTAVSADVGAIKELVQRGRGGLQMSHFWLAAVGTVSAFALWVKQHITFN